MPCLLYFILFFCVFFLSFIVIAFPICLRVIVLCVWCVQRCWMGRDLGEELQAGPKEAGSQARPGEKGEDTGMYVELLCMQCMYAMYVNACINM